MGLIKFAVKSSIVGGLIYYTVEEGLWSNSDDSIKFCTKLYNNITPYLTNNTVKDVVKDKCVVLNDLPNISTMTNCARGMWNIGVKKSINYVSELPTHATNGVDTVMSSPTIKNAIESFKNSNEQTSTKSQ
ncbi:hypothetical protein HCN44_002819 [Aphidius gifuensis]|uniref:MICOS complex subunit MIC13 n=1 Tax=Aphidius gifuensis TaxID=684658 RepID=A0A834XRL1_APHGI|nr:uncharacterized protein LOC122854351 [Aphidius gifuensis]KAF7991257.1 hypothetical protein HCN44_002819 [Aphidius gifuensis]